MSGSESITWEVMFAEHLALEMRPREKSDGVRERWRSHIFRRASAVAELAGKNVSSASSDRVISTGVPKTVVVLMKARTPDSVISSKGMTTPAYSRFAVGEPAVFFSVDAGYA